MLVEIESGVVTDLGGNNVNNPRYVSTTGHVVYGHGDQALMAVPFDLRTHRTTGEPARVLPEVIVYGGGATQFAVSETGTAVYGLPSVGGGTSARLVIVGEGGMETPLPVDAQVIQSPRFSPDGGAIVYSTSIDLLVYDRETGENRALVAGFRPFWSRDGTYIYFRLGFDGFRTLADGSGDVEQLYSRDGGNSPLSLSLDGTQLLVGEGTPYRGFDLVIMSEDRDTPIFKDYLRADWNETMGTVSPDGERAAYVSDESGIFEVYVRSFPAAEDRVRVSDGGGAEPVWAPDGSAIYYRNGRTVMRAFVSPGEEFAVDTPRELFEGPFALGARGTNWDVHPSDGSFLFVRLVGAAAMEIAGAAPVVRLEYVTDWFEELRQRMGGN